MITQHRAFTLVEVLIVVVIMAVLAAVVIPQFSSSADDAKKATSEFNLSTLRSVIQIYKAQHNGRFPTYDGTTMSLTTLVSKTRVDGTIDPTTGTCGPYLVEFPQNPFTGTGQVKVIASDPAKSTDVTAGNAGGWLYNVSTGSIWLDSDPVIRTKGRFEFRSTCESCGSAEAREKENPRAPVYPRALLEPFGS